jgi:hypothetical protein
MAYINTTTEGAFGVGSSAIQVGRFAPLDPSESPDSSGDYPSGTIDLSHALSVGNFVFSATNKGVDDNTRIKSITQVSSDLVEIELSRPLVSDVSDGEWLTFDQFQNAARGAKFSFSKFPVPSITDQVPLFDITTGQQLVDSTGLELVTDTNVAVADIANKDNATSVVIPTGPGAPSVPVAEIFQESSETSTTLLGVNRAEEQLSLFSDVSVLGLNEDDWEFFTQTGGTSLGVWESRESEIFGTHYNASFIEQTGQQALEIGAFPVPYSYPFGPRWANRGLYDEDRYNQYLNFIRLGNDLYDHFSSTENEALYGTDFKEQFLDRSFATIGGDDEVEFTGVTESEGFALIDTWTRTWVDINDGILPSPISDDPITPVEINQITDSTPLFSNTRPGYSTSNQRFSYLQSKRTYRYQPGRISGYTFGVRASSDSGSESNILEWGVTNPTDQYVFQLKGATFNIVRRSTVPLDAQVIEDLGLDPIRDQQLIPSGDPNDIDPQTGETREYFTIEIPRDLWNTDPLNGNGPSRYLLTSEEVTMYKIEFSWYGAIGANFYVYIPVGNGEARWVLVHRLIIENKLGQPCLEDPNFRFRYSLNIRDTARLRSPQFVYKYGASMYIDGGDEGTTIPQSYSSGQRAISSGRDNSVIGIYPKELITNKQGYEKINKKTIVPKAVNVTSDEAARIRIGKCKACPGFGHNYNLGLKSGEAGRLANFKFNDSSLSSITINPDILNPTASDLFQLEDNDAKIIVDGIYSTYIQVDESSFILDGSTIIGYTSANLRRVVQTSYTKDTISGPSTVGNPSSGFDSSGIVVLNDGSTRNLLDFAGTAGDTYPDQMRLSRFDSVAASDVPLTGTQIDLQFLNPSPRDAGGTFADFQLGVTDKRPIDDAGVLKFEVEPGVFSEQLGVTDTLFGEYLQNTTARTRQGFERGETNFTSTEVFEIDFRIPQPEREDSTDKSGNCSKATVSVQERVSLEGVFTFTNPETEIDDGNIYLFLDDGFFFPNGTIRGGELGIGGAGTGVTFTSEQQTFITGGISRAYATVSDFPAGFSNGSAVTAEITPVRIEASRVNRTKVFKFNPYPLYFFVKMRDNSAINSISVSEIAGKSRSSHSPNWIISDASVMETDDSGGRATTGLAPTNFVSDDRLDSARIDVQCAQQLRPLTFNDAFYVGKNETKIFDLSNIYNFDREVIVPDLFNTEATFFVAEPTTEPSADIQITLNTSEQ